MYYFGYDQADKAFLINLVNMREAVSPTVDRTEEGVNCLVHMNNGDVYSLPETPEELYELILAAQDRARARFNYIGPEIRTEELQRLYSELSDNARATAQRSKETGEAGSSNKRKTADKGV